MNAGKVYFRIIGHMLECFKELSINTAVSFGVLQCANKWPGIL